MDKIPTPEEWLNAHHAISYFYDEKTGEMVCFSKDIEKAMNEYAILKAKYYVKAALKTASKDATLKTKIAKVYASSGFEYISYQIIDKDSILNAYSENFIQ